MSEVIFARPDYNYDSYNDLYDLITLSGYSLVKFNEMDLDSDNLYIMTTLNGENENGYRVGRARLWLWDLEWRMTWAGGNRPDIPGISRVLASDRWYAGTIGADYVTLGSHPDLKLINQAEGERYDVAMLAYMTNRRGEMAAQLRSRGLTICPNSWGIERARNLLLSKAVLHVNQWDDVPTLAPLRIAIAAAYGKPLICETPNDPYPLRVSHALFCDFPNLADFTAMWTRRNESRIIEDYGRSLHYFLCREWTFRRCVEAVV